MPVPKLLPSFDGDRPHLTPVRHRAFVESSFTGLFRRGIDEFASSAAARRNALFQRRLPVPVFLPRPPPFRGGDWKVAGPRFSGEFAGNNPAPVEITGPVDRRMIYQRVNSGLPGQTYSWPISRRDANVPDVAKSVGRFRQT